MNAETILASLKVDLGITTNRYDARLTEYIGNAEREIQREGVTLTDGDEQLVTMYAGWTWRRRDSGDGMPRMLRYALNNRVFQEKMSNG